MLFKLTQEQIAHRLAEWNSAATQLPRPTNGARELINGLRFQASETINGVTGKRECYWEMMTPNWDGTGITWPESIWEKELIA